jgi:Ca-activated chloride channel homolog
MRQRKTVLAISCALALFILVLGWLMLLPRSDDWQYRDPAVVARMRTIGVLAALGALSLVVLWAGINKIRKSRNLAGPQRARKMLAGILLTSIPACLLLGSLLVAASVWMPTLALGWGVVILVLATAGTLLWVFVSAIRARFWAAAGAVVAIFLLSSCVWFFLSSPFREYRMAESALPSIGFSTGGAKDIGNFRKNIENHFLPIPTDITYEGLFYDYYFDTGKRNPCSKLFCPSYATAASKDPLSQRDDYYLSVGLNSGIPESEFARKRLNLVIVLDISGSMGSPFDSYYYDKFGASGAVEEKQSAEDAKKSKIQIATQSVVALLDHLHPEDSIGIVLFDDEAYLAKRLGPAGATDLTRLKRHILDIEERGGTQFSAGMDLGTSLYEGLADAKQADVENRIIFLTDAMPNLGDTSDAGLFERAKTNADRGINTTFIGMGVDFNTELVETIAKIRGANYYSVHSAAQFKKRMDDEFDYMVTPLVFNLTLSLQAKGFSIEKVYGSPEANEATGEIMRVNTLFPSKVEEGQTRGGLVLLKLRKTSPETALALKVTYEDREGRPGSDEASIEFPDRPAPFYENSGIRKGIVLARYADLSKNWILDELGTIGQEPSIGLKTGITAPRLPQLTKWERRSRPLRVSGGYRELFALFGRYFEGEAKEIGDETLQKESQLINALADYSEPR